MREWIAEVEKFAPGKVMRPTSDGYAAAVRIFNSAIDGRPGAVLRCGSAEDVVLGLHIANAHGVGISVRGGGHNSAGLALRNDGGLLLDMSAWRTVSANADTRRARSAPGATWADYDQATQAHGLASPGGVVSSTGVVGLTLSGGIGALRGLHGLACDNVCAFDMVLADGSLVAVDKDHHPDLFWAVRGGGSNFGIVTSLEFEIHPASRVVTGMLSWPLAHANRVFERYMALMPSLSDRCIVDFFLAQFPGTPQLLVAVPRYIGNWNEAVAELAPLRTFLDPQDTLAEMSYCDSQKMLDAVTVWDLRQLWRTHTLPTFDLDALATLVELYARAPSPMSVLVLEHLKGGVNRVSPDATPVGFRGATLNLMLTAHWADPADDAVNQDWIKEVGAAVAPYAGTGAYPNYLPQDASSADIRRAFGANYRRLQRIKSIYDPENRFRCNQNIEPCA